MAQFGRRLARFSPMLGQRQEPQAVLGHRAASSGATVPASGEGAPEARPQGNETVVKLNYLAPPTSGKFSGRYMNQPDQGDAIDELVGREVVMHNGRTMQPPASLKVQGFEMKKWPTEMKNFTNTNDVREVYYEEVRELVKWVTGCNSVLVFDHAIRGAEAFRRKNERAPVERVHSDYTLEGAPRRLENFAKDGFYSHMRKRDLTQAEIMQLAETRYMFLNVWRPIDETPVERKPLALCDASSVPQDDHFIYQLKFPGFKAQTNTIRFNEAHKWHYYPLQTKDECIIFKVFDKKETGTRLVYYSTFDDPNTRKQSPSRSAIVVRTVAFFDGESEFDGTSFDIDFVTDGDLDFFDMDDEGDDSGVEVRVSGHN